MKDEQSTHRTARIQEAVLRTLVAELQREGRMPQASEAPRAQAIDESARRVAAVVDRSPAHAASKAGSANDPRSPLPSGVPHWPRILVVEDDDEARLALARGLAPEYEVVTARDGAEGFELASGACFDAIIADVAMPNTDGVTMVERIREMHPAAVVPVMFLTGETAPAQALAGFAGGAVAYLVKPIDLDVLDQELRWALGRP